MAVLIVPALTACSSTSEAAGRSDSTATLGPYDPVWATYHDGAAEWSGDFSIDTSAVADGYVCASGVSDSRLKFQVICGEQTYNYDLDQTGAAEIFPLNCGDGAYTFRIMQNTTEDKYIEAFSTGADVEMASEFEPFLRNSSMIDYSADSQCVQLANQLRGNATDEIDLVNSIYGYITDNVDYDYEKAWNVASATGYVPDPDQTLSDGKGICFDYAALAAAMMRSQGIPCKVVTGYVDPDDIYHAWNVIYLKEKGWIAVSIEVQDNQWKQIDLTFAASEGSAFDPSSRTYTDRYVY